MKFYLIVVFSFLVNELKAQNVLWATEILEVSSEKRDISPRFKAIQVLGQPNALPQAEKSPNAWQPSGANYGEDYIKVKFEKPIKIRQVAVAENYNPGSIARIFGYTKGGIEYLLYENKDFQAVKSGRMWNVIIPETAFEMNAVKLLIVHDLSKGEKQIDAIGISDSETPIEAKINLVDELNENEKENLGTNINSQYAEVAPIISPNGKNLFFTRTNHPENIHKKGTSSNQTGQDIWQSTLGPNGQWSKAVNLGPPVNNESTNAAVAISSDNNSLYVLNIYLEDGKLDKGLSKTSIENGKWSMPQEVKIDHFQALPVEESADSKVMEIKTEYAISQDEEILIMGLKRASTYGGKDLYFSRKIGDHYSTPVNMGPVLNSAGNEGSPFLAADNKTLYFNSNGFAGYGDADIYVSKRLDDTWTNWSEPKNLGKPINSSEWDGYFSIDASGEYAYFSSYKNSMGSDDIFRIKLTKSLKPEAVVSLNLEFIDADTKAKLVPELALNSNQNDSIFVRYNKEDNTFSAILEPGKSYVIDAQINGYIPYKKDLDFTEVKEYKLQNEKVELMPIKAGQKMVLDKVFFEQGKSEITENSYSELDKLLDLMQKYPKMTVLLEGHTDNQGQLLLNVELSQNRVDAVKDYLISEGDIDAERIQTKAWGPTKPIASNNDEESRKKNRRVEFTIINL